VPDAVPDAGVLVVDGVFAQRLELADSWDLVVWVHADDAVRVSRMAARDGASADPEHPDQRRYLDAQAIYRERCRPEEHADLVVDNADPERLRVVRTEHPG
jgi:uridine kinase